MALTAEQQAQLDFQAALSQLSDAQEASRRTHEKEMEQLRAANSLAIAQATADANAANIGKQAKIEAVRLAKETLIENRRNQPVDAREVTAADITAYANILVSYING